MMRVIAGLMLALSGGPALALSCMPADVAREFRQAESDEDAWLIVLGRMTFDESRLPREDLSQQQPPQTDIPARISGRSLGPDGFAQPFERNITLRALCLGPWCAGAESGEDYLMFLEQEGEGYIALASPCPGFIYPRPTAEQIETVTSCFTGGRCEPQGLR